MPRPSTVATLPPDILERLQELLRDPRVSQLEVTERINDLLAESGEETRVSKSAVNRYKKRMDKVGEKLAQSREIARMWIGRLGAEPQGEVGHLLNEVVRNLAFDTALAMAEDDDPAPPKALRELAQAVERLERAAGLAVAREDDIRKTEQERAKARLAELEREAGSGPRALDPQTLRRIREEVYGLAGEVG